MYKRNKKIHLIMKLNKFINKIKFEHLRIINKLIHYTILKNEQLKHVLV